MTDTMKPTLPLEEWFSYETVQRLIDEAYAAGMEEAAKECDDVQLDAVKSTAAIAWGWLWHVTTADDRVNTARDLLGEMLDKDLKRYGIQTAKAEGAHANVQEIEAAMLRGEFGDPLDR